MKEAFTYMFKDNKFTQKAFTYFGFVFLANFALQYANTLAPACKNCTPEPGYYLWFLIGLVLMIIPQGYVVSCIKSLIEQKGNYVLPFFNIKNNFVQGFKYGISIWLLALSAAIFTGIMAIIIGVICTILGLQALGLIIVFALITILILALAIYSLAFSWIFANKGWWTSFLRFGKASALISKSGKNYWITIAILVGIGLVSGFLGGYVPLFICKLIGCSKVIFAGFSALVSSIIAAYTVFVWAYLCAKVVKPEFIETL